MVNYEESDEIEEEMVANKKTSIMIIIQLVMILCVCFKKINYIRDLITRRNVSGFIKYMSDIFMS